MRRCVIRAVEQVARSQWEAAIGYADVTVGFGARPSVDLPDPAFAASADSTFISFAQCLGRLARKRDRICMLNDQRLAGVRS